jgi:hypothetical protein
MSDTRQICRDAIKNTVPKELWEKNGRFIQELHVLIKGHRLTSHPLIPKMKEGQFSLEHLKRMHLEFRYPFTQIFTDALIQAMYQAVSLEPRYGPIGKVSARFLLQYNVLDELGFQPSGSTGGEYGGTPLNAHFIKFDETLKQLGASREEILQYRPHESAVAIRRMVEASFQDYPVLVSLLAVGESVFDSFTGPWAKNVGMRTNVDTQSGFHAIHVEHEGPSVDVIHSEDLWFVLMQALEPARYGEVRSKVSEYLDTLVRFADYLASA